MTTRRWTVPMTGRDPDESGRTATVLELFFDLVFVVAVASAANALHHGLIEDVIGQGIVRFAQVFFAIWWAWMNFTWFASAYDTDDVPYRLNTFVGITGALILAAGVPSAFETGDFTVVTVGYVVMRLGLVALWLRASRESRQHTATARRFALGVTLAQIGWVSLIAVPDDLAGVGFAVLVIVELAVPIWAESASPTPWHREHVEERYGLFTIIVLGESILASSLALQTVTSEGELSTDLVWIVVGGLLTVFSMWWLYFARPRHQLLTTPRKAFVWGYGHYFVWAAAAAVGAGLAVAIDHTTGHGDVGDFGAGAAVAIPVAVYLATVWILNYLPHDERTLDVRFLVAAVLVLLTPLTGRAVLLTGLIVAMLLTSKLYTTYRSDDNASAPYQP